MKDDTPISRKGRTATVPRTLLRSDGPPTAADLLPFTFPGLDPGLLTPTELKTLLSNIKDVEVLLALALAAFSGLHPDDLISLRWDEIIPGTLILVRQFQLQPDDVTPVGHWVSIPPALDAWLGPFYGTQGQVVSLSALQCRMPALARELGIELGPGIPRFSYGAYRYALTRSAETTALELGVSLNAVRNNYPGVATEAEARAYFSLAPEAVGIKDWSGRVATYRKRQKILSDRKRALPPPAIGPSDGAQCNQLNGPTQAEIAVPQKKGAKHKASSRL
jgi:hypothetical protein